MLQDELAAILSRASENAQLREEEFFSKIAKDLHMLCERVAKEIKADSAAVFFLSDDARCDGAPMMVMRGAYGALRNTFDARIAEWQASVKVGAKAEPRPLPGFAYRCELTDDFAALTEEERSRIISGWSVTNQIWHLARGRVANSNRAMDNLHGGAHRAGSGDKHAYKGENLYGTFRNIVGVPIFGEGEQLRVCNLSDQDLLDPEYPECASSCSEFRQRYRVIGILKVEGKRPARDEELRAAALERVATFVADEERDGLDKAAARDLESWLNAVLAGEEATATAFAPPSKDEPCRGPSYPAALCGDTEAALELRKRVADSLSEWLQAEFTRQNLELLVLLAMQIGRLLIRRIIKYGASKGIVLSENEVGFLNIRWRDIDELSALLDAAQASVRFLEFHLTALQAELKFARRQEVYRARVSDLLDPSGPIREIAVRPKEPLSLVRKLVRKQRSMREQQDVGEVAFPAFRLSLSGYDYRNGERCVARGAGLIFMHRAEVGRGLADIQLALGHEGGPRFTINEKQVPVAVSHVERHNDPDLPLVRRILAADVYGVDDLAGARIITDYESDIEVVLDELRARVSDWNMKLGKTEDIQAGKMGGYRATHATVELDVAPLVPAGTAETLRRALGLSRTARIWLPAEVQIRTGYQHSWALKTHGSSYKREDKIGQELRDEQHILSNVLAEADWLSDIVRSGIEEDLLPPDYGERRLLAWLRRQLPRDDRAIARFGIQCAKEVCRGLLRYNGQPEYSFAMEVYHSLVYSFEVTDSRMLLLAALRNIWRRADSVLTKPASEPAASGDDDMTELLAQALEELCPDVLAAFRNILGLSEEDRKSQFWLRDWLKRLPPWFWIAQRSYRQQIRMVKEDKPWRDCERLRELYANLKRRHGEGQGGQRTETFTEWLERIFLMEAAYLLASLTELPFEPTQSRRRRLSREYRELYREICRYMPNGPTKAQMTEELERRFRAVETQLDLPREPEWAEQ